MGWYQDNFPGSPAQIQRNRIAWIAVGYSVVVGAAVYFFAPGIQKLKKATEEGTAFYDRWGIEHFRTDIKERGWTWLNENPTEKEWMKSVKKHEIIRRDDGGAEIPDEQIRAKYN